MQISIALCTYNGDRYLQDQIESILNQSRQPDEIVIYDDGSTDDTVDILRNYEHSYPDLFKVFMNCENLGPNKNFEKAILQCSGDVISVSDQDDIWHEEKLERQINAFKSQKESLIFHNSIVATESLSEKTTLWDTISPVYSPNGQTPDDQFANIVTRNFVQGASMLFDESLRNYCFPIPENWFYDHWIATVAAYLDGIHAIDDTLLVYRQHEDQEIGVDAGSITDQIIKSINVGYNEYESETVKWSTLCKKVERTNNSDMIINKNHALRVIERRKQYAKLRAQTYDSEESLVARTLYWLRNLESYNYWKYGNGTKSAMKDFMGIIFPQIY